jgi:hypothetical protein
MRAIGKSIGERTPRQHFSGSSREVHRYTGRSKCGTLNLNARPVPVRSDVIHLRSFAAGRRVTEIPHALLGAHRKSPEVDQKLADQPCNFFR